MQTCQRDKQIFLWILCTFKCSVKAQAPSVHSDEKRLYSFVQQEAGASWLSFRPLSLIIHCPFRVLASHPKASWRPLPSMALVLNIWYCRFYIWSRPNPADTSSKFMAPGMSYLLARISTGTPLSSSSCSMISNSCLEYSRRSRSAESTTKTTAFVSW